MSCRSTLPSRISHWAKLFDTNHYLLIFNYIYRYTTLYNSECDSLNPRSKQEIIRQVEKEEKSITSSSNVKPLFSQVTRKTDPKIIEEVNTKYCK